MSASIRRSLPLVITFVVGMLVIVDYYFKVPQFNKFVSDAMVFVLVVASFSVIVGTVTSTRLHVRNVLKKREGWYNSIVLLVALYGMIMLGFVLSEGKFTAHPIYSYWWTNIYVPLDGTIFSLLAFYIASAAYRAFRVRTREATILLVSAVIVMLGRAPVGQAVWPDIGPITSWIMSVPNTAGMRGITIGVALGSLSMGIRVLLGRERGYLGPGA